MIAKDSLLLMLAAVAVSLATPVSAVTCSVGKVSRIPVSNGAVLDLRRTETLILNCKGNPVGTGEHFSIHDDYPGTTGVIWKNEQSLNYTWYIEATEYGPVRIFHFIGSNFKGMVFELTIRVHNLDSLTEMPTPRPCTTPSPEQTSLPTVSHSDPNSVKLHQYTQSLSGTSTTDESNRETAATNAVESHAPYLAVGVVLVLLLLLCIVGIIMIYCRKGQSSKLSQAERGQGRTDKVCENRQSPQLSDATNSQDESTISLDGSNSDQNESSDHNTSTQHLTADPGRPELPQAHSADLQANTRELQLPANGQRSKESLVEEGQGNDGDKVCENQLSDTNSSRDESTVQDTSLASSNGDQDVFNDHDTSTQHLNE